MRSGVFVAVLVLVALAALLTQGQELHVPEREVCVCVCVGVLNNTPLGIPLIIVHLYTYTSVLVCYTRVITVYSPPYAHTGRGQPGGTHPEDCPRPA